MPILICIVRSVLYFVASLIFDIRSLVSIDASPNLDGNIQSVSSTFRQESRLIACHAVTWKSLAVSVPSWASWARETTRIETLLHGLESGTNDKNAACENSSYTFSSGDRNP